MLALVLVLLVVSGLVASRRRYPTSGEYVRHVADADSALERARAADRGWDREALDLAARSALAAERPDATYDELHLVRVDDRPGVEDDRAHLVATGPSGEARVVLARHEGSWVLDRVT